MTQHQLNPVNLSVWLGYTGSTTRPRRPHNFLGKNGVVKRRAEEIAILNQKPEFGGKLNDFNYALLVKLTENAESLARLVAADGDGELSASDAFNLVKERKPDYFKTEFWGPLGILDSAVSKCLRHGYVLAEMERSVFEGLLELGRDQIRPCRTIMTATKGLRFDPADATFADLDLQNRQDEAILKAAEPVVKVNKKRKTRDEVIDAAQGVLAAAEAAGQLKGQALAAKREAAKVPQEADQDGDGSESPVRTAGGIPVASPSFENQCGKFFVTQSAKVELELSQAKEIAHEKTCESVLAFLHNKSYLDQLYEYTVQQMEDV